MDVTEGVTVNWYEGATFSVSERVVATALASVATEARLAELDAANLPAVTDAINAKTTNLPTDPADESLFVARAAATDALITTLQATAALILKWLKNWMQVVMSGGTGTLVLKDDDDTTTLATQTITDANATDGTVTRTRGV